MLRAEEAFTHLTLLLAVIASSVCPPFPQPALLISQYQQLRWWWSIFIDLAFRRGKTASWNDRSLVLSFTRTPPSGFFIYKMSLEEMRMFHFPPFVTSPLLKPPAVILHCYPAVHLDCHMVNLCLLLLKPLTTTGDLPGSPQQVTALLDTVCISLPHNPSADFEEFGVPVFSHGDSHFPSSASVVSGLGHNFWYC